MKPLSDVQRRQLIQDLDRTREQNVVKLSRVNPLRVVYPDAGWRVKDVIAHLTAWEAEVVHSIDAYIKGGEYSIPGFTTDDLYNDQVFKRTRNFSVEQIRGDWASTRAHFKAAIRSIPLKNLDGQIMCPWQKYSTIDGIVRDMINHEAEHFHNILTKVD